MPRTSTRWSGCMSLTRGCSDQTARCKVTTRSVVFGTASSRCGQVEVTTQYAVVHGEIALLSNRWTMRIGDDEMSATSAEVARRQPDGTWRYVIDNPDGAGVLAGDA